MCGSQEMVKQDGMFVCQYCGTKYSIEEARNLMVEGTVKIDNSEFVKKYLANARRAYEKEDWEEVEKYYNLVEQNAPKNMEAVFFSSYGKVMLSLTDAEYFKRQQKFNVLNKSISVINDYYEVTDEDKENVIKKIGEAIIKMSTTDYVFNPNETNMKNPGSVVWQIREFNNVKSAFLVELKQIAEKHNDSYIQELINEFTPKETNTASGGCYVATAVYGSYDCPEVWTLRRFRDYTLAKSVLGRLFIRTYYAVSPTLVKWFGKTEWFKNLWKPALDKMVAKLNSEGVEDTPYEDKNW